MCELTVYGGSDEREIRVEIFPEGVSENHRFPFPRVVSSSDLSFPVAEFFLEQFVFFFMPYFEADLVLKVKCDGLPDIPTAQCFIHSPINIVIGAIFDAVKERSSRPKNLPDSGIQLMPVVIPDLIGAFFLETFCAPALLSGQAVLRNRSRPEPDRYHL